VIDVEGNGQHPPDLVELGLLPIRAGQPGEPAAWLFKPEAPITPIARRIHGITNDATVAAPLFTEREAEVRACLDEAVLVAHNAGVDLGVLKRKMPGFSPAGVLDTLALSRRFLPGQPSYRLGSLARALHLDQDLPPGLRPHRVTYDVIVTARLFVHLATRPDGVPRSTEELQDRKGGDHDGLF
jgi:exodeoxyribonuclease X